MGLRVNNLAQPRRRTNKAGYGLSGRIATGASGRWTISNDGVDAILNKASFTGFTLAAHMKFDDSGQWSRAVSINEEIVLGRWGTSSSLRVFINSEWQVTTASITNGAWMHLVVAMNSSGSTTVYIDGTSVGTNNFSALSMNGNRNSNYLFNRSQQDRGLNGSLDDVRFYDRAISAAEASQVFNGAVLGDEIMHFIFDDDSGDDISGNDFHLTGPSNISFGDAP